VLHVASSEVFALGLPQAHSAKQHKPTHVIDLPSMARALPPSPTLCQQGGFSAINDDELPIDMTATAAKFGCVAYIQPTVSVTTDAGRLRLFSPKARLS
jgi:hypothetical protein